MEEYFKEIRDRKNEEFCFLENCYNCCVVVESLFGWGSYCCVGMFGKNEGVLKNYKIF